MLFIGLESEVPAPETKSALHPPELVEDVVPLMTEEALPNMLEEQSATLMTKSMLG